MYLHIPFQCFLSFYVYMYVSLYVHVCKLCACYASVHVMHLKACMCGVCVCVSTYVCVHAIDGYQVTSSITHHLVF